MGDLRLYHNPRCSKSRGALALLRERGEEPEVIEYLETPPDRAALESLLDRVPDPPSALVRRDGRFEELAAAGELDAAGCETRDGVIAALLAHPELLQRPVVVRGDRARIARPPEKALELL